MAGAAPAAPRAPQRCALHVAVGRGDGGRCACNATVLAVLVLLLVLLLECPPTNEVKPELLATRSGNVVKYGCRWRPAMRLAAVIHKEGDWYIATNPETGTTTQGKTFDEALANLQVATELYLEEFPLAESAPPILTTFEVPAHA